jgi:hypothetical protein
MWQASGLATWTHMCHARIFVLSLPHLTHPLSLAALPLASSTYGLLVFLALLSPVLSPYHIVSESRIHCNIAGPELLQAPSHLYEPHFVFPFPYSLLASPSPIACPPGSLAILVLSASDAHPSWSSHPASSCPTSSCPHLALFVSLYSRPTSPHLASLLSPFPACHPAASHPSLAQNRPRCRQQLQHL